MKQWLLIKRHPVDLSDELPETRPDYPSKAYKHLPNFLQREKTTPEQDLPQTSASQFWP